MKRRAKKAIEWVLPQSLLRRRLQRQHTRAQKFWPGSRLLGVESVAYAVLTRRLTGIVSLTVPRKRKLADALRMG